MEETPEWLISNGCTGFLWVPNLPCWQDGIWWFVFSHRRLLQLSCTKTTGSLLDHRVVITSRCSFYNHHLSSHATDSAFAIPITMAKGPLIIRITALLYDSLKCHLTLNLQVIV